MPVSVRHAIDVLRDQFNALREEQTFFALEEAIGVPRTRLSNFASGGRLRFEDLEKIEAWRDRVGGASLWCADEGRESDHAPVSPDEGWFCMQRAVIDATAVIGPYGLAIYVVLAKYAHPQLQVSAPSIRQIAGILHIGTATVQQYLDRLVDHALIHRTRRLAPDGGYMHTEYALLPLRASSTDIAPVALTAQGS